MSAAAPMPAPAYHVESCGCRYIVATGRRVARCDTHRLDRRRTPPRRECSDCKQSYLDIDSDALCSTCRARNTARNLAPATCERRKPDGTICGNPLRPAVYRWPICDECQHADLIEDVRRYGSE